MHVAAASAQTNHTPACHVAVRTPAAATDPSTEVGAAARACVVVVTAD
jgi:hypothetical protein